MYNKTALKVFHEKCRYQTISVFRCLIQCFVMLLARVSASTISWPSLFDTKLYCNGACFVIRTHREITGVNGWYGFTRERFPAEIGEMSDECAFMNVIDIFNSLDATGTSIHS